MKYRYRLEEKSERRLGFVRLIRRLAIFALFFIAFYLLFLSLGLRPQVSEESLRDLSLMRKATKGTKRREVLCFNFFILLQIQK